MVAPSLTDSANSAPTPPPNSARQLGRHAIRQFRIDGLYILLRGLFNKTTKQKGHVAIYKDRRAASISAFVHLLGVFGVAVLGYFVLGEWYIGSELQGSLGQDSQKLLALLITAKMFELIAIFSLSSIIFTVVRYEMVLGNGAPLAALGAGLQISDPTFLISKTLMAIVKGEFSKTWKKVWFIVLVIYFTILAIFIAPATATALMPRLDTWRAGGTTLWWNASEPSLFPETLNETHGTTSTSCGATGTNRCLYSGWETISSRLLSHLPTASRQTSVFDVSGQLEGYLLPETIFIDGRETALEMTVFVRNEEYHVLDAPYTIASMAHAAVIDGLVRSAAYWQRASLRSLIEKETLYHRNKLSIFNIDVKTAVTHSLCYGWRGKLSTSRPPLFPDFRTLDMGPLNITDPRITDWLRDTLRSNMTVPQILWFDPTPYAAGNASIGVVVAIPNNEQGDRATADVHGCFIDARWVNATLTTHHTARTASGTPDGFVLGHNTPIEKRWVHDPTVGTRVRITPEFAKLVNPVVQGTNLTVLQELLRRTGSWKPDVNVTRLEPSTWVEATLGTMLTNAMARSRPDIAPVTALKKVDGPWWRNFLPQGSVYGPGGEAYDVSEDGKQRFFSVEMVANIQGYGYGRNDLTILLSMACMCVYAITVLVFVVWSVSSGVTSTSWDTVLELVAIALKSLPPAKGKLEGVSAGIMTAQPLKQRYCMSADEETITLVAVDGELEEDSRVKPNKAYW